MGDLIEIHDVNEFFRVRAIPHSTISGPILANVATFHETDLERFFRQIICDPTKTPHGPTEIADILTSHIHIRGAKRFAGFVLKGKSFQKVSSRDVTHQFAKLRTVPGLAVMVFAAVGQIQDDAQRDFVQAALDADCDYLILNARECGRLLIAYEKICPQDGTPFDDKGVCRDGHRLDDGIPLQMTVREKPRYTVASRRDVSHGGAKRYCANVILDKHYPRDLVKGIVRDVTEQLKNSRYYRNEQTKAWWGATPAHVVCLFVGYDLEDVDSANWVCRTCWIDPSLASEMRPAALNGNDQIGDVQIEWSDQYERMKEFVKEHQGDKGEFLEMLQPMKYKMITVGNEGAHLFGQYQQGIVTEESLISQMRPLEKRADELYRDSWGLPLPPTDCKDYDQACQNLFATVHDMFLVYSERGLETWEKQNREWLLQDTLKRYQEHLRRLAFEEKKIH